MKTVKLILIALIISSVFVKCKCSDELEGDEEPPVIQILSPNEGLLFYTKGSSESPTKIIANAKATDNNKVARGSVIITGPDGKVAHVHIEKRPEVYTSFSTAEPGNFTVTFQFFDPNGNSSQVSRTVFCEAPSDGGGTDSEGGS